MHRVLFVANSYGHLRAFHVPFMRFLQDELNAEVYAVASPTRGSSKEYLTSVGVRCVDVTFHSIPLHTRNIFALVTLRRLIQNEQIALIHTHTPVASFVTRVAAKGLCPVMYTAHGFRFGYHLRTLADHLSYGLEYMAARWTADLLVMNDEDWQSATRMGFVPGKNLHHVRGVGIDTAAFTASAAKPGNSLRLEHQLQDGSIVFLCIAYFRPVKDHLMLLRAWAKVESSCSRAVLMLAGEGPTKAKMESMTRSLGLRRVYFLGHRDDVPALITASDVVVLASRREGLPRSLMEAMAVGRPVIATDAKGSRDLIGASGAGLLTPQGDADALAEAMLELAESTDKATAMVEAGRKAIGEYELAEVLRETAEVYKKHLY